MIAVFTLKEPIVPGTWFDVFWTVGPTALALLLGLSTGWLVLLPDGFIAKVLGSRWLSRGGRDLSIGLYLWHLPVFILLIPLVPSLAVRVPLMAAHTMLIAYGSFRFVERSAAGPPEGWHPPSSVPPRSQRPSLLGNWNWPDGPERAEFLRDAAGMMCGVTRNGWGI